MWGPVVPTLRTAVRVRGGGAAACTAISPSVFDVIFVGPAVEMAQPLTPHAREQSAAVPFWPTELGRKDREANWHTSVALRKRHKCF